MAATRGKRGSAAGPAGPTLTESNPDVARRFVVAYVQGLRFFHDAFAKGDPDARREAVQVLADSTRLAPALIEEIAAARAGSAPAPTPTTAASPS